MSLNSWWIYFFDLDCLPASLLHRVWSAPNSCWGFHWGDKRMSAVMSAETRQLMREIYTSNALSSLSKTMTLGLRLLSQSWPLHFLSTSKKQSSKARSRRAQSGEGLEAGSMHTILAFGPDILYNLYPVRAARSLSPTCLCQTLPGASLSCSITILSYLTRLWLATREYVYISGGKPCRIQCYSFPEEAGFRFGCKPTAEKGCP